MPSNPALEPTAGEPDSDRDSQPKRRWSPWYVWVVPTAIGLLAFVLSFARTKDYGLLGYDSYPIIVTSRVSSLADLAGNFTEKLMDGRYAGDFYRPLLNLSFALDYAIWGLRPIGYQLTNALLLAGCAPALFALVRRLAGSGAFVGPLVAMASLLLHPALVEVVPVPPRRADLLCGLFLALSVTCHLSARSLAMRRPPILPALFGLLAIASKETGFILLVLVWIAVLLCSPRRGVLKRVLHATIATVPLSVVALGMLGARISVVGGAGGHLESGVSDGLARLPSTLIGIAASLTCPQPVMRETSSAAWLAGGLLLGLAVTATLMYAGRRQRQAQTPVARRPLRAGLFGLTWGIAASAAYVAAGRIEPWYVFLPAVGLAIVVGAAAEALVAALREGRLAARVTAATALLMLLGLLGWQARYSPLLRGYDEYERATVRSAEFLEALRARIDAAPDGSVVVAPPLPKWTRPRPDRPTVFGVAILTDYSVQAWAELACPDRRIRVVTGHPRAIRRPSSGELVVVLYRLRPGFEDASPQAAPHRQRY